MCVQDQPSILCPPLCLLNTHVKLAALAGGESVKDVARRLWGLIAQIEKAYVDKEILIVSHGDTLSIFWAVMRQRPLENHREVALQTGELRKLHVDVR